MSKIGDFYKKAMTDGKIKAEISDILGDKELSAATDGELSKICGVAKKQGFNITVDEAKAYLSAAGGELNEEELDAVAGGKKDTTCGTNGTVNN